MPTFANGERCHLQILCSLVFNVKGKDGTLVLLLSRGDFRRMGTWRQHEMAHKRIEAAIKELEAAKLHMTAALLKQILHQAMRTKH